MDKYAFIIAGVIASSIPSKSIVVLANIQPTKVLRIGQFYEDLEVFSIKRRYVDFKKGHEFVRIMVGDGFPEVIPEIEMHDYQGGRTTVVSSAYRDNQLQATNLANILMQAGVESCDDGYRIFYIEPGSIYDIVGLKNGDIITKINGYYLTDPITAIRTLNFLRDEHEWVIDVKRDFDAVTLLVRVPE